MTFEKQSKRPQIILIPEETQPLTNDEIRMATTLQGV